MGARTVVQVVGLLGVAAGTALLLVAPEEPGRTAVLAAVTAAALIAAVLLDRSPGARAVSRALWVLLALVAAGLTAWSAVAGGWTGWGPALLVAGIVVGGAAVVAPRPRRDPGPAEGAAGGGAADGATGGGASGGDVAAGAAAGAELGGVTASATDRVTGPGRDGVPRTTRRGTVAGPAAAGVVAVAVVVALTAGTAAVLDGLAVTSVEAAGGPEQSGPVPDPVAVRWRTPPGDPIRDVRAGGGGVVVLRRAEVSGLDARTGAVRWTHRRAGVGLDELAVSPDGRTVVVSGYLEDPLRGDRDRLVIVLDGATGTLRWSEPVADEPMHVTDTFVTVTSGEADDGRAVAPLVARSPDTGRPLWSVVPDPRCEFRAVPTVAAAVVLQDCPGPVGGPRRVRSVRALDPATGAARWTSAPVPVDPDRTGTGELPVTADGRAVVVDLEGETSAVLDVADGTVRARETPGLRFALLGDGPVAELDRAGAAVRVLGPDGPVPVPAAGRCPPEVRPRAFAVVGGRPAVLCADDDGRFDVRVPGRAPLSLGRLAGPRASGTADGWIVTAPGAVVVAASPLLSPDGPGPQLVGLGG